MIRRYYYQPDLDAELRCRVTQFDDIGEIVSPRQARRQFLESKKGVVKDSTVRAYRFPTKQFIEFCEKHEVETTGEISGYVIESWKQQRRSESIKLVTLHNNVKHLRVFIRWCESVELVEQGLAARWPFRTSRTSRLEVTISESLRKTLVDYIEGKREDVDDDFGRDPLFTTVNGRTPRQRAYKNRSCRSPVHASLRTTVPTTE